MEEGEREMLTAELAISIAVNIIVLAFFAGVYVSTIKNHEKMIEDLGKIIDMKVTDLKENFEKHLNRVEQKQDKHNNIIERMVRVEDSCKSSHKRLDEIENFQHNCIFKKGSK